MFLPLTFTSNGTQSRIQCVQINIIDDNVLENRERFQVNISPFTPLGVVIINSSVSVFIEDNDGIVNAHKVCMSYTICM